MSRCLPYPQPGYVKKTETTLGEVKIPQQGIDAEKPKDKNKERSKDRDREKKKKHKKNSEDKKRKREHESSKSKNENGEEKKTDAEERSKKIKETTMAEHYKKFQHPSKETVLNYDKTQSVHVNNDLKAVEDKSLCLKLDARQDREKELNSSIQLNTKSNTVHSGLLANGSVKKSDDFLKEQRIGEGREKTVSMDQKMNGYLSHDDSKKESITQKHSSTVKHTVAAELSKESQGQTASQHQDSALTDRLKSEERSHLKRKQRDDALSSKDEEKRKREEKLDEIEKEERGVMPSISVSALEKSKLQNQSLTNQKVMDESTRKKMKLENEKEKEKKEKDDLRIGNKERSSKDSVKGLHGKELKERRRDKVDDKLIGDRVVELKTEVKKGMNENLEKKESGKDEKRKDYLHSHSKMDKNVEDASHKVFENQKPSSPPPPTTTTTLPPLKHKNVRNGEVKIKNDHIDKEKLHISSSLNGLKENTFPFSHDNNKKKSEKESKESKVSSQTEEIKSNQVSVSCQDSDFRKQKDRIQMESSDDSEYSLKTFSKPEAEVRYADEDEDVWWKARPKQSSHSQKQNQVKGLDQKSSQNTVVLSVSGEKVWEKARYLPEFDICILPYVAKY